MSGSTTVGQVDPIDHLVIVAGGKGTRLARIFSGLPKVLVPVCGKPVLAHQLELAVRHGIKHATVFAGYLGNKIKDYVGDGNQFGLNVDVFIETEPLGNAGAVMANLDRLPQNFIVAYGDVMLAVDFEALAIAHISSGADFTAMVHPNDHPLDSDLIEADEDGWVRAIHTYPHPINSILPNRVNAALYAVRRDALRQLVRPGPMDFTKDIMPELVSRGGRILSYNTSEYLKDMGTPDRLTQVEQDYVAGRLNEDRTTSMHPAIFVDRDGTLNIEKGHISSPGQIELFEDAASALRRLRRAGFRIILITNQPVVARGEATEADLIEIHRKLEWELGKGGAYLDGIYYCPHHPDAGFAGERADLKHACDCRKPAPGLVERAQTEHRIDISRSWMIGDRTVDVELAKRIGLASVLVLTGAAGEDGLFEVSPDHIANNLAEAAEFILASKK